MTTARDQILLLLSSGPKTVRQLAGPEPAINPRYCAILLSDLRARGVARGQAQDPSRPVSRTNPVVWSLVAGDDTVPDFRLSDYDTTPDFRLPERSDPCAWGHE